MDSITRSIDALSVYLPESAPPFDLLENYIAKKTYYPAAINRVLGVLDRGYKQRHTVNGEITRNHEELFDRWKKVKGEIQKTEETLRQVDTKEDTTSQDEKHLVSETRPRSSGSTSSNTTLTQGVISPTARTSSRDSSSIRSGARISSLPSQARRESMLRTPRTRSVSTQPPSSRSSRLNLPLFTPRSKTPLGDRPLPGVSTGTGGLIPLQARPRWNSSPIASVIGSSAPKLPTVIVTPSRIPRSGRQTPTKLKFPTPPSVTARSPDRRTSMAAPPSLPHPSTIPRTPQKRMSMVPLRSVSTSSATPPRSTPGQGETPPVPKVPELYANRRQTMNFSANNPSARKITSIPRPSTAQGYNRSVSGPADGQAPPPRWRG